MKIALGVALALIGIVLMLVKTRKWPLVFGGALILAVGGYLAFTGIRAQRIQARTIVFIAAAGKGDLVTVRRMADVDPVLVNSSHRIEGGMIERPLYAAAKGLHSDVVEYLLTHDAVVDDDIDDGSTALHAAGESGTYSDQAVTQRHAAIVKMLLAHGAAVSAKDDRERTPLMANADDATAAAILIQQGADVKARDTTGRTALHYAVSPPGDHSAAITLLLDHGAEIDARDQQNQTPLLAAGRNVADLETLIARGADPKARDKKGWTALHYVARSPSNLPSDLDVLGLLCACGLDPETRDQSSATPLGIAREQLAKETDRGWRDGRRRIVRFLEAGGPCRRLAGASKEQRQFVVAQIECDEGFNYACETVAWAYDNGKGTAVDKPRSVELYEKACSRGSQWACTNLGYAYANGEGVAANPVRAAELYGPACDGGQALACHNLAQLYESGRGVTKDPAKAVALFRRACDDGDRESCDRVARMK